MYNKRCGHSMFRVPSSEFRVPSSEFRVPSSEFRVPCSEFLKAEVVKLAPIEVEDVRISS